MKVVQSTVLNAPEGSARRVVNAMTNVAIREKNYSNKVTGKANTISTPIITTHRLSSKLASCCVMLQSKASIRRTTVIKMQEIRYRRSSVWDGNSEFHPMKCAAPNTVPIIEAPKIVRLAFDTPASPDQNMGTWISSLNAK
jgi:hypothetical protein